MASEVAHPCGRGQGLGQVWPRTPEALVLSASRNARQTNKGLHWLTKIAHSSEALQKWANPGRSREDQQAGSARTATPRACQRLHITPLLLSI
eukprot:9502660-Pyramimonas_sp.AAC.1